MKIICHVGPWSVEQYPAIARGVSPSATVICMSGHRSCDESGMLADYYKRLSVEQGNSEQIPALDRDIILRCRLLRALPQRVAKFHLDCMRAAIRAAYDRHEPDLVLSETIDSYIMDLMYFECVDRGIPYIGLAPTLRDRVNSPLAVIRK